MAVVGAGAVSPRGLGWRGLGSSGVAHAATLLAATHPGVRGFEVPPLDEAVDAGDAKARRLMSRAARFAAIASREALRQAAFSDCSGVGMWLGVGASGGSLQEIVSMLGIAREGSAVSMARLGSAGLAASHPLNTFAVLNNFTMCHAAILEGTQGPNGAFFSRGAGTVHALGEAVFAIQSGDCDRALAGGADTALHPVTWSELVRGGFAGLVPSEGAAVLALARARDTTAPLAIVERVSVGEPAGVESTADLVVLAPWGEPARARLRPHTGAARVLDATELLGEALAATPALAWLIALDEIVAGRARRAAVLSLGPDGEIGTVVLGAPA